MASYGAVKVEGNHFNGDEIARDRPTITSTLVKLQEVINYQAERLAYLEKNFGPVLMPASGEKRGQIDTMSESSSLRQELEAVIANIQENNDRISDLTNRADF